MSQNLRLEYLVCYDVEDTPMRTKLFKELRRTGLKNVQKSVFWGCLTKAELTSLCRFVDTLVKKEDRVLITRTNFNGRGSSLLHGYEIGVFEDWEENNVI